MLLISERCGHVRLGVCGRDHGGGDVARAGLAGQRAKHRRQMGVDNGGEVVLGAPREEDIMGHSGVDDGGPRRSRLCLNGPENTFTSSVPRTCVASPGSEARTPRLIHMPRMAMWRARLRSDVRRRRGEHVTYHAAVPDAGGVGRGQILGARQFGIPVLCLLGVTASTRSCMTSVSYPQGIRLGRSDRLHGSELNPVGLSRGTGSLGAPGSRR
jgi:hypothetical protein